MFFELTHQKTATDPSRAGGSCLLVHLFLKNKKSYIKLFWLTLFIPNRCHIINKLT